MVYSGSRCLICVENHHNGRQKGKHALCDMVVPPLARLRSRRSPPKISGSLPFPSARSPLHVSTKILASIIISFSKVFTLFLGLVLLLFSFVLNYISKARTRRLRHAEAQLRGCENPPILPRTGFLGLGRLSEVSKANKEGRTPQWFIEKFEEVGKDIHIELQLSIMNC
jgi:hypothetical protein